MGEYRIDLEELDAEIISFFEDMDYTTEDEISPLIVQLKESLGYESEEVLLLAIEDGIDEEAEEGVSPLLEEIRALIEG